MLSNAVQFPYTTPFWLCLLCLVSKLKQRIYTKKFKIAQNKCIRFCLFLESRAPIGVNEFRKINWLPTRERFEQCVSVGVYKLCKNISPSYMSDIFVKNNIRHITRRSTKMLNIPMKNTGSVLSWPKILEYSAIKN